MNWQASTWKLVKCSQINKEENNDSEDMNREDFENGNMYKWMLDIRFCR